LHPEVSLRTAADRVVRAAADVFVTNWRKRRRRV
jgi:hypothetical protein